MLFADERGRGVYIPPSPRVPMPVMEEKVDARHPQSGAQAASMMKGPCSANVVLVEDDDASASHASMRAPPLAADTPRSRWEGQTMDEDDLASTLCAKELAEICSPDRADILVWTKEYVRSQVGAPLRDTARRARVGAHRCPECHSLNDMAKYSMRLGGTVCEMCGCVDRSQAQDISAHTANLQRSEPALRVALPKTPRSQPDGPTGPRVATENRAPHDALAEELNEARCTRRATLAKTNEHEGMLAVHPCVRAHVCAHGSSQQCLPVPGVTTRLLLGAVACVLLGIVLQHQGRVCTTSACGVSALVPCCFLSRGPCVAAPHTPMPSQPPWKRALRRLLFFGLADRPQRFAKGGAIDESRSTAERKKPVAGTRR